MTSVYLIAPGASLLMAVGAYEAQVFLAMVCMLSVDVIYVEPEQLSTPFIYVAYRAYFFPAQIDETFP